jgi:hypothetical protein
MTIITRHTNPNRAARGLVHAGFLLADMRAS